MFERVNEEEMKTTTIFVCEIVWELILVLINYGPRIVPAGDHNIGIVLIRRFFLSLIYCKSSENFGWFLSLRFGDLGVHQAFFFVSKLHFFYFYLHTNLELGQAKFELVLTPKCSLTWPKSQFELLLDQIGEVWPVSTGTVVVKSSCVFD